MAEGGSRDKSRTPPKWVAVIASVSSRLNALAAFVAAVILVAMASLIIIEISLRFFSMSTYMTDTLVGYGVAAITFLGMAWALEKGTMIRVTVVTQRLPASVRPWVDGVTLVAAIAMLAFLISYQWFILSRDFVRGTTTQNMLPIPLWIPDTIFFVGLMLLALQFVVRLLLLLTTPYEGESALVL